MCILENKLFLVPNGVFKTVNPVAKAERLTKVASTLNSEGEGVALKYATTLSSSTEASQSIRVTQRQNTKSSDVIKSQLHHFGSPGLDWIGLESGKMRWN